MASIEMNEKFEVQAPIEKVWRFMMDPERVSAAMPGAKLEEIIDDRNYVGTITVKVGAIKTTYRGRVQFVDLNEAEHSVKLTAEGQETGQSGAAKGTMSSKLTPINSGATEVVMDTSVDITGRIMQVGRGMIKGVSHQLFLEFVKTLKATLESEEGDDPPAPPQQRESIPMFSILLKTLWAAITGFVRRPFGGGRSTPRSTK